MSATLSPRFSQVCRLARVRHPPGYGVVLQAFAVKPFNRKMFGIDVVDTTQIYAVVPRLSKRFVKRVNPASLAKVVFGDFVVKLVQAQRSRFGVYLDFLRRDSESGHYRSLAFTY